MFFSIRLFRPEPYYALWGDQCKYLILGKNFPRHALWNDSLYMLHPPPYGFSIGIFHFVLPLFDAGIIATLFWFFLGYIALCRYMKRQKLSEAGIVVGLLYVSLSFLSAFMDSHISRTPILFFLTALSLAEFEAYIHSGEHDKFVRALLSSFVCMLVSEQSLALIPAMLIIYFTEGTTKMRFGVLTIVAVSFLSFMIWPLIRLLVYISNPIYPAGMDGIIERMDDFPIIGILQPNFLPNVMWHHIEAGTNMDFLLSNLNFTVPFYSFFIPLKVAIILFSCLILSAFGFGMLRRDIIVLKLFLLSALFYLPICINMPPWYGICFLIPFSALIGKGLSFLDNFPKYHRIATIAFSFVCVFLSIAWMLNPPVEKNSNTPYFILSRKPVTRGQKSFEWIKNLPGDIGVMGPVGLTPEIAYLTGKRVVAIPFDPCSLDEMIDKYQIQIIILSDNELKKIKEDKRFWTLTRCTAQYILRNPQKYKLIYAQKEQYLRFYETETFLFFRPLTGSSP